MADALRLLTAFLLAGVLTALTTPLAIRLASRTGFIDSPAGYKAHATPTPYLGGVAVLVAALASVLALDTGLGHYWPLLVATVALALVGVVDDKVNLHPLVRVGIEAAVAAFLWQRDMGWSVFDSEAANLLLTIFWLTAIVNALNLMDNLDGAASSVGAVSAAGVAILAAIGSDIPLAVIAAAFGGALCGFLRYNLAGPARIFLGDGGSMTIGCLLASSLMVAPMGDLDPGGGLVVAAVMVGLPIFDTTLVVISRRRRGSPIFSGATDHTTHRLLPALKSPRAVAAVLATVQAGLCALAIETTRLGPGAAIGLALFTLVLGATLILAADGARWTPVSDDS